MLQLKWRAVTCTAQRAEQCRHSQGLQARAERRTTGASRVARASVLTFENDQDNQIDDLGALGSLTHLRKLLVSNNKLTKFARFRQLFSLTVSQCSGAGFCSSVLLARWKWPITARIS